MIKDLSKSQMEELILQLTKKFKEEEVGTEINEKIMAKVKVETETRLIKSQKAFSNFIEKTTLQIKSLQTQRKKAEERLLFLKTGEKSFSKVTEYGEKSVSKRIGGNKTFDKISDQQVIDFMTQTDNGVAAKVVKTLYSGINPGTVGNFIRIYKGLSEGKRYTKKGHQSFVKRLVTLAPDKFTKEYTDYLK